MDSGNSGSVQSSSGGDEEYGSRVDTISSFLHPSLSFGSISNHPQPPPASPLPLFRHQPNTFFDPPTQNLGAFTHSQPNPNANPLYNLDFVWSRELRSDPNYTVDLGNLTSLPPSSSSTQPLLRHSQSPFPSSSSPINPSPSVDGNGAGRATATTPRSDQTNTIIKNSRKRTRASRRAPTTVLTTDTSNFRQKVQEFTGIPALPFSASPYPHRLDFFGGGGGGGSGGGVSEVRSGRLENLGSLYPFRPSAQKVQASPFVPSSSSPPLLNSNNTNTIYTSIAGPSNNTFPSTSNSYQIRPDLAALPKQPQTMLNMQNPYLTSQTQTQTQTPLKYPQAINAPFFNSKFQGSSGILSLDELGMSMSHEHVNANLSGFPSQGSSGDGGQEYLGSFGGVSQNGGGNKYKTNCSASTTSEFHSEKSLEKCFLEE